MSPLGGNSSGRCLIKNTILLDSKLTRLCVPIILVLLLFVMFLRVDLDSKIGVCPEIKKMYSWGGGGLCRRGCVPDISQKENLLISRGAGLRTRIIPHKR